MKLTKTFTRKLCSHKTGVFDSKRGPTVLKYVFAKWKLDSQRLLTQNLKRNASGLVVTSNPNLNPNFSSEHVLLPIVALWEEKSVQLSVAQETKDWTLLFLTQQRSWTQKTSATVYKSHPEKEVILKESHQQRLLGLYSVKQTIVWDPIA